MKIAVKKLQRSDTKRSTSSRGQHRNKVKRPRRAGERGGGKGDYDQVSRSHAVVGQ